MQDANHAHITLAVAGVETDLQVLGFEGREKLNQPYRFDIELVSERPDLDLDALINQPAYLAFGPTGKGVHGVIYSIEQGDSGKRLTRYAIGLRPVLAYLGQSFDQRIFQHLSVPQIIADVLQAHGIQADAFRFQLGHVYPERDYCVQYDESDLHFIQRLCEEEGISFHFQHSEAGHVLVFGDDQTVFPKLAPVAYQQGSGLVADRPRIEDRKGAEQIYVHAQRDWDQNIQHDQKIRVGHERHDSVEANAYSEFQGEEHRTTHGDRKTEVRVSDHLTVGDSQHVKIGSGQFVEAGDEIHYYASSKVVIDAGMELTASGGGSFLKLDPSGVTLSGATININSGGAPGSGSGARPILPGQVRPADADKAGNLLEHLPAQKIARLAPPAGICLECLRKAIRERMAILSGEQP